MAQLPEIPDSPKPSRPEHQSSGEDISEAPTQKQQAQHPRSWSGTIEDIIRLDTIKMAARRSQETLSRIPTVHIPAVIQRRLSARPRNRVIAIILLIGLLLP